MKTKNKTDRRDEFDESDKALRRLTRAPETVNRIYELAESLYMRDGNGNGGVKQRMSLADIEQVGEVLRQAENDIGWMKKQFLELATLDDDFQTDKIPVGF